MKSVQVTRTATTAGRYVIGTRGTGKSKVWFVCLKESTQPVARGFGGAMYAEQAMYDLIAKEQN